MTKKSAENRESLRRQAEHARLLASRVSGEEAANRLREYAEELEKAADPMPDMAETALDMARRHVAAVEERIAAQEQRLAEADLAGHNEAAEFERRILDLMRAFHESAVAHLQDTGATERGGNHQ